MRGYNKENWSSLGSFEDFWLEVRSKGWGRENKAEMVAVKKGSVGRGNSKRDTVQELTKASVAGVQRIVWFKKLQKEAGPGHRVPVGQRTMVFIQLLGKAYRVVPGTAQILIWYYSDLLLKLYYYIILNITYY